MSQTRLIVVVSILLGLAIAALACYLLFLPGNDLGWLRSWTGRAGAVQWSSRADAALRKMLEGQGGDSIAASILAPIHPNGADARLGSFDINVIGDQFSVTFTINWRGRLNWDPQSTVVVWEFDERQHVRESPRVKQLDDYFRTELYATLRANVESKR